MTLWLWLPTKEKYDFVASGLWSFLVGYHCCGAGLKGKFHWPASFIIFSCCSSKKVMSLLSCWSGSFFRWYPWEERNLVRITSLCSDCLNYPCSSDLLEHWQFFSLSYTLQLVIYLPVSLHLHPQDGQFCRYIHQHYPFLFELLRPKFHLVGLV